MAHHQIDIEGITSRCLDSVTHGLEERESGRAISVQAQAPPFTIFKVPEGLRGINDKAVTPELVFLGPYHRRQEREQLPEFEEHKWFFLKSFLRRTDSNEERLVNIVAGNASSAFGCYSEPAMMLSDEFVETMLLDGCFIVELLLQIYGEEDSRAPVLTRPGIIPILIRDLLKLENQVPYSLLQSLFQCSESTVIEMGAPPHLCVLALKVFNLVHPELSQKFPGAQSWHYNDIKDREHNHLLDLFCFALLLVKSVHQNDVPPYRPPEKSIPCVTQLRNSGVTFKAKSAVSKLDISFRRQVLEIPTIAINDFMITLLINCIALERYPESGSKPITEYVYFMHCLINRPEDVLLLCSNGIISPFFHDNKYVVDLFNKLAQSIVFNVGHCYLSKEFKELKSYYYSNWASVIRTYSESRTYFSHPWVFVSVVYAILLLVLTAAQTVYTMLDHYRH